MIPFDLYSKRQKKLQQASQTDVYQLTNESLWATCRERARRPFQAGTGLRGYPALDAADETEATLAAEPAEKAEKKPKTPEGSA